MSRKRKTFISDEYAARQAAFAKLGVGHIAKPLRVIVGTLAEQMDRNDGFSF